jgi:hypothetical protein
VTRPTTTPQPPHSNNKRGAVQRTKSFVRDAAEQKILKNGFFESDLAKTCLNTVQCQDVVNLADSGFYLIHTFA